MPMALDTRNHVDEVHGFVSPFTELNVGLWCLFAGATILLGLRVWIKVFRKHGLWYDDHILIVTWMILLANNILIVHEFATGYVLEDSTQKWDDRMHILISISSCGTLIGQALSKTAFGVTLLRLGTKPTKYIIWFCIVTMNLYMIAKLIIQWSKICGKSSTDLWYRLDICVSTKFRDDFKEGGNIYNVLMDFVFATIPWFITRHLELRRMEKIGLSVVMSLGMIVAIVSAIRIAWKDEGNGRDEWYMWRNGMSQIWYSSEITGTIMVQCIPVLRTFVRDMRTQVSSPGRMSRTTDGRSSFRVSIYSKKRISSYGGSTMHDDQNGQWSPRSLQLQDVPESPWEDKHTGKELRDSGCGFTPVSTFAKAGDDDEERWSPILFPSRTMSWPRRQGPAVDEERDAASFDSATTTYDEGEALQQVGLTPPPPPPPPRHKGRRSY